MSKDSVDLARSLNASSGPQRVQNYQAFYGGIWVHPDESPLVEQRWKDKKERWRSDSTLFDVKTHYVAPLTRSEANDFVARNHYLGGGTQGESLRVGLFSARTPMTTLQDRPRSADRLVGVAIFADLSEKVAQRWAKGLYSRKKGRKPLKLARLVLTDEVAFNGETWFLGASIQLMKQGYRRALAHHSKTPWETRATFALRDPLAGPDDLPLLFGDYREARELADEVNVNRARRKRLRVEALSEGHRFSVLVSLSDPVPHVLPGSKVVMPGHIGRVYQAFNGTYQGRTDSGNELWTPDGRPLSGRTLSKIGTQQPGKDAAVLYLERFTGVSPQRGEALGAYRKRAKSTALASGLLLNISHPGKHVYLWNLQDTGLPVAPGATEATRFYGTASPQLRDVLEVLPPGGDFGLRAIPPELQTGAYISAMARWRLAHGQKNASPGWGWVHPLVAFYASRPTLSPARREARPAVRGVMKELDAGRLSVEAARAELTQINSLLDHYP